MKYNKYETLEEKTNRLNDAAEQGIRVTKLESYDVVAHEMDIELAEQVEKYRTCRDEEFKHWQANKYARYAIRTIREMAKHLTQAELDTLVSRYSFFGKFYRTVAKEAAVSLATPTTKNLGISAL